MSLSVPSLSGERVVLRPLAEADLPRLLEIVTEPGVREWWMGYDADGLREDTLGDPDVTPFAIELDGELIGVILATEELDPDYKYATIDLAVDASHLGQGLGSDALRALIRYLIDQRGHHHVMIDPAVVNERAIAAYRKVGFKPVGVMRQYERGPDGTWRDALLMDLVAGEER
ncbi:MAG TPA: GNAT family protein [Coriobacteriia bacterium]|jgi:aminoglycoside 6'-N-acetyltransferase